METFSTQTTPTSCHVLALLITFLFLSNLHTTLAETTATTPSTRNYRSYVQTACKSTTYPDECYKSLLPYASKIKANPQKLCSTGFTVAIGAARNESSTISLISKQKGLSRNEREIIKDCIENIKDAIDNLKQSQSQMKNLRTSDVKFQVDNVKTWASASITDVITCTDGVSEGNVSKKVRSRIRASTLKVTRPISNALSLVNGLY